MQDSISGIDKGKRSYGSKKIASGVYQLHDKGTFG